ncbi:MAG: hypothetical protein HFH45_01480 [Bacilli bacterium]|nr:hypothetical protein [Bacilli bacterium]
MKKIGLLIPKTNLTVEYELQYLFSKNFIKHDDYAFYVSKLNYKTNYKDDKVQFLKDLADDSYNKIKDLEYLGVDYIAYFCTSSALINSDKIISNNPAVSLIEEAKKNNISKCLLITPYNDVLGSKVQEELFNNDIKVLKSINLDLLNTKDYFDFGINKLEQFIINNYKSDYENIIISCTNLPTLHFIDKLEKQLNTKIISSNLSMFNKIIRED